MYNLLSVWVITKTINGEEKIYIHQRHTTLDIYDFEILNVIQETKVTQDSFGRVKEYIYW